MLKYFTTTILFSFISIVSYCQFFPNGFKLVKVTDSLFSSTSLKFAPDGRIFVLQQTGEIFIIKNGKKLKKPFIKLDVSDIAERGLDGMAFDPDFTNNNYIYLYFTTAASVHNTLNRYTVNGDTVLTGSEKVILAFDSSSTDHHNGGALQFGKDGKIYLGIGDHEDGINAQNLDSPNGKILRINADGTIPNDNPFATGSDIKKMIWARGLRNPFSMDVDKKTGRIFINDVGLDSFEEINDATAGGLNFGWPHAEGPMVDSLYKDSAYTSPIYSYIHPENLDSTGCAITGGVFFNGDSSNYPSIFHNKYFFQDLCADWINTLDLNNNNKRETFAYWLPWSGVSLKQGPDGNLYYLSRSDSSLYKIIYQSVTAVTESSIFNNIEVYPNPVVENLTIKINSLKETKLPIVLSDALGKKLVSFEKSIHSGETVIELTLPHLPPAIYILKIGTETRKIIK